MTKEEQVNRIADLVLERVSRLNTTDETKILGLLTALQSYMVHVSACKEPAMGFALVEVAARSLRESVNANKPLMPYVNCPLCQKRIQFGHCEHDLSGEVDRVTYEEPPRIIITQGGQVS